MEPTQVAVSEVRQVGADTVALELETPPDFEAEPGEFVLVRATVEGEEVARHYTLSSPRVEETFEITVGVDPEGDLSPYLADREPGDELEIEGPFGTVTYDGDGDVLVLGGGPGIGPAVAIAERAHADGHAASVVYLDDAPAHVERLSTLAADGADVAMVTDEAAFRAAVGPVAADGQAFVFGFQEFCDLALDALAEAGVDPDDALVESFG